MKSWFLLQTLAFFLQPLTALRKNALILSSDCPVGKPLLLGLRLARGLVIHLPIWSHHNTNRHLEKSFLCPSASLISNLDSFFLSKANDDSYLTPLLPSGAGGFGHECKFLGRLSLNDRFWYLMMLLSAHHYFSLRFALNPTKVFLCPGD